MKPTVHAARRRPAAAAPVSAPVIARPGPYLNALKHGLRSDLVLLPGDNVAEFCKLRSRLFHLHRPRTIEEAQCVEAIAVSHWRIARCRLEQAHFKRHLGAAMRGDADTTGSLCSPDTHRLHHRGADCTVDERRLEKSMLQARNTLSLLQKQRLQNLTVGGVTGLEDYTVFLAEGEPVEEEEPATADPAGKDGSGEGTAAEPPETSATRSADGEIPIGTKRTPGPPAPRFPKHWSRRQREAAARRAANLGAPGAVRSEGNQG